MVASATKEAAWTVIKIRPATRRKYDEAKRVKRLKFVELADLAIDALIASDPDLKRIQPEPKKR